MLLISFTLSHFHKSSPNLMEVFQPLGWRYIDVRFTTNGMCVQNNTCISGANNQ